MDRETEIIERLDKLENQLNGLNKTIVMLTDVLSGYSSKVDEVCLVWKHDFMDKYGFTRQDLGLSRVDDEAILKLSKLGVSVKAQAELLGCHVQSIINHRNKLKGQGRL